MTALSPAGAAGPESLHSDAGQPPRSQPRSGNAHIQAPVSSPPPAQAATINEGFRQGFSSGFGAGISAIAARKAILAGNATSIPGIAPPNLTPSSGSEEASDNHMALMFLHGYKLGFARGFERGYRLGLPSGAPTSAFAVAIDAAGQARKSAASAARPVTWHPSSSPLQPSTHAELDAELITAILPDEDTSKASKESTILTHECCGTPCATGTSDIEELAALARTLGGNEGPVHYDLDPEDLQVGVDVVPGGDGLKLRSRRWFNDSHEGMTALYLERYLNYGLTREELQSNKPIIGIAQTGSDLTPCNRHHIELADRVKDGIRAAGGVPMEFPVHPIQETGKRPTAALDRNLAYLGLVEVLHGYPLDGVVLTTGCDKTTPAMLMGAATVNIPAIVLSGGPMLDGWYKGELVGSGTIVWKARKLYAAGEITFDEYIEMVAASATSVGHCSTMGTALSMNSLAEALGMSLPGCAAIPGPYRERGQMAYETGKRIVQMVHENLTPSKILTRAAFRNAVVAAAALGASSNCPIHNIAIARHMGVDHDLSDWQELGPEIPLLVDCQPAGRFLGEKFHRAGGVPAVMAELLHAGKVDGTALTVTGKTWAENLAKVRREDTDRDVIREYGKPLRAQAGYVVMSGNFMSSGVLKMSVLDDDFRKRYLSVPGRENVLLGTAVVFEGTEDYHKRIEDPLLNITEQSVLIIRNSGPVGYPGSAEVVNMQPPAYLLKQGISTLPTLGDGRQSGTSGSPSILNVSPESAVGGGLALLKTGDPIRIDLNTRRVDVLIPDEELAARRMAWKKPVLKNKTPWEEMYRALVGQLESGGCLEMATRYQRVTETKGESRHNH